MSKIKISAKKTETANATVSAKPAKPAKPLTPVVEESAPVVVAAKKPAKKSETSPDEGNKVSWTGKEITARAGTQRHINLTAMSKCTTVGELRRVAPNQSWISWAMNNGYITL